MLSGMRVRKQDGLSVWMGEAQVSLVPYTRPGSNSDIVLSAENDMDYKCPLCRKLLTEGWSYHYRLVFDPKSFIGVVCGPCAYRVREVVGGSLWNDLKTQSLYSFVLEDGDEFYEALKKLIAEENCPQCGEKH
jgi:hypothetical protein